MPCGISAWGRCGGLPGAGLAWVEYLWFSSGASHGRITTPLGAASLFRTCVLIVKCVRESHVVQIVLDVRPVVECVNIFRTFMGFGA